MVAYVIQTYHSKQTHFPHLSAHQQAKTDKSCAGAGNERPSKQRFTYICMSAVPKIKTEVKKR